MNATGVGVVLFFFLSLKYHLITNYLIESFPSRWQSTVVLTLCCLLSDPVEFCADDSMLTLASDSGTPVKKTGMMEHWKMQCDIALNCMLKGALSSWIVCISFLHFLHQQLCNTSVWLHSVCTVWIMFWFVFNPHITCTFLLFFFSWGIFWDIL